MSKIPTNLTTKDVFRALINSPSFRDEVSDRAEALAKKIGSTYIRDVTPNGDRFDVAVTVTSSFDGNPTSAATVAVPVRAKDLANAFSGYPAPPASGSWPYEGEL